MLAPKNAVVEIICRLELNVSDRDEIPDPENA
jgi:hypothetical protein